MGLLQPPPSIPILWFFNLLLSNFEKTTSCKSLNHYWTRFLKTFLAIDFLLLVCDILVFLSNIVFLKYIYEENLVLHLDKCFAVVLFWLILQCNLWLNLLYFLIDWWCRSSISHPRSFWPSDVCESPVPPLPRPSSLSQSARNVRCLGVVCSVKTSPLSCGRRSVVQ